jgi:hypothetical protein
MQNERDQSSGQSAGAAQGQKIDGRFSQEPHAIYDQLRPLTSGTAGTDFVVMGRKQDGTVFAWSTGDKERTEELAKQAAPVLAGLEG